MRETSGEEKLQELCRRIDAAERRFLEAGAEPEPSAPALPPEQRARLLIQSGSPAGLENGSLSHEMGQTMYWLYVAGHSDPAALEKLRSYVAVLSLARLGRLLGQEDLPGRFDKELGTRARAFNFLKKLCAKVFVLTVHTAMESSTTVWPSCLFYAAGLVEQRFQTRFAPCWLKIPDVPLSRELDSAGDVFEGLMARLGCLGKDSRSFMEDLVPGLPASVAFKVGMSWLMGDDLPLDKHLGRKFLLYAALCGEARAYAAFPLLFAELYPTNYDSARETLRLCQNGVELCDLLRDEPKLEELVDHYALEYEYDGHKRLTGDDLLNNCMILLNEYKSVFFHDENSGLADDYYTFLNNIKYVLARRIAAPDLSATGAAAVVIYLDLIEDPLYGELTLLLNRENPEIPTELSRADLAEYLCRRLPDTRDFYLLKALMEAKNYAAGEIDAGRIETLAALGDGRAVFCLCGRDWYRLSREHRFNAGEALGRWKKAADAGDGMGCFNYGLSAFLNDQNLAAIEAARRALDCGIVNAYYILYKAYLSSRPELAYSCLRLAAEYLFPAAVKDLRDARSKKLYKPLPFLVTLEKIEDLSRRNDKACYFMAAAYTVSGILPEDPFKNLEYLRRALIMGHEEASAILTHAYKLFFAQGSGDLPLGGVGGALATLVNYSRFRPPLVSREEDELVYDLIRRMFAELRDGTTFLERGLFAAAVCKGFFAQHGIEVDKARFEEKYRRENALLSLGPYCRALNSGEYVLLEEAPGTAPESGCRRLETLRVLNEEFKDGGFAPRVGYARALTAVRSLTQPVNYPLFKREILKAANSNVAEARLLSRLCFDAGFVDAGTARGAGAPGDDLIMVCPVVQ